ncbi:MAG: BACON domain-containing carbohydrate-binding protein, partial [Pseudomonadota bacterium]
MSKHPIGAVWGIGLFIIVMFSVTGQAAAATAHNGQTWQGSQSCQSCHYSEALEMHGSSHYQWQGKALYTVNGPDIQGKLNTALNSYCISILGNWNACGSCHVGLGAKPEATATPSQLQNIDCLICHQKDYKRKKVNGVFVPDTVNMAVTMDQAVQTVHKPVRSNCVQCHAKGGGGDNNKRGDMTLAHATTTDRDFDVHMSSTGANLTCQQCHTTLNHRIAGRGSDLRQTDLDVQVNCSTATCHTNKTTSSGHATADVNRHVSRIACQTCHIKTYARNAVDTAATETTEAYRDWTIPEWSTALSRWEPTITRGGDLKPEYAFWNGTSWNYSLNETIRYEAATGTFPTSRPEGGINESGSMLYPFKYKKALQPLADSLGVLVALDTSVYFSSGNYDAAVKAGLTNMGYPSTTLYSNVETDTYQLITHEVMPKGNALTCTQCHTATATQMNFKDMGYAMKGTQSTTCTQCHGQKNIPSYTSLHNKHVTDKKYDCSWCHGFSRSERGLKMPSGINTVLLVSPNSRSVSKDAGAIIFSVSSTGGTMPWTAAVTPGSSWLSITSGTSGSNAGTIDCKFTANTSTSSRTATIRITAGGATGSPQDVTVIQAGSTQSALLMDSNSIGSRNTIKISDMSNTLPASGGAITVSAWDVNGNALPESGGAAPLKLYNHETTSISGTDLAARFLNGVPMLYKFSIDSPKVVINNVKISTNDTFKIPIVYLHEMTNYASNSIGNY